MWLFTRDSFCSIVRHAENPNQFLVRARRAEDIKQLWPKALVQHTPDADYAFRAAVDQDDVIAAVGATLRDIRYKTDFKGGVAERARHDAYSRVWSAMRDFGLSRKPGSS
jgi:hypothetical protein